MGAINEITSNQLLRLIGTPDCPLIIDVQIDEDFNADPYLIPTAKRHPHTDVSGLAQQIQGRKTVIYCQKGKKLSQGVVAWLRAEGIEAEYLKDGMQGWQAFAGPSIPNETLSIGKQWVTRHRPKIDRIACPWLIRRFIAPEARFLFVTPSEVLNVAERFNGIPFDIEGEFWSHREDKCTFDTMLEEFHLTTEPLLRMAKVIRAADTDTIDKSPEAAGLLALSVGLSRHFKDDQAQLDAGMIFYDALFRWARDGQSETHSWPHGDKS